MLPLPLLELLLLLRPLLDWLRLTPLELLLLAPGLDNNVNECALSLASGYSQQGMTMWPEGATSNWNVSVPSGIPRSNS